MNYKLIFGTLFILLAFFLLAFYWFIPTSNFEIKSENGSINFQLFDGNYNFSRGLYLAEEMQFYPKLRFETNQISYRIDDCPLQKQNDMERAFEIIADETILEFYPVQENEQIIVNCQSESRIEDGLFIAGEGGPTNASKVGEFYVIFNGKILLIKDSKCETPNIAIHELLHVLGLKHSENKNNIMYNISRCSQTLGEDIPLLINELYSIPSQPDLSFGNVTAQMNGKYLDTTIEVKNNGLANAPESKLIISTEDRTIEEFDIAKLNIGYGTSMTISNLLISELSVTNINYEIQTSFQEINKKNNKIVLEIKK
jgi:Matrixin/CARDB